MNNYFDTVSSIFCSSLNASASSFKHTSCSDSPFHTFRFKAIFETYFKQDHNYNVIGGKRKLFQLQNATLFLIYDYVNACSQATCQKHLNTLKKYYVSKWKVYWSQNYAYSPFFWKFSFLEIDSEKCPLRNIKKHLNNCYIN